MRKFRVFSADWEREVLAATFTDAVMQGTMMAYNELGDRFNVARSIAVVKENTDITEVYRTIEILEDLNMYFLARQLNEFFEQFPV